MAEARMREFWDARAREDAYFFVDDRMAYREADLEKFWEGGREALDLILGELGVAVEGADEVVEIGCGVGRITRVLAERARSVRAVDVSPEMLDRARDLNDGLGNVEWILGDGHSLAGIDAGSATVCFSHVVFQHIPDPAITLGYIADMGRVLAPGGWAGFQVSNSPDIHHRRGGSERLRMGVKSAIGRAPRGQADPEWLGSAIELPALEETAAGAGLATEHVAGEGTQFCLVLLRKPAAGRA